MDGQSATSVSRKPWQWLVWPVTCLCVVMQPFLGSVSLKLLASWPSSSSGFTAWNLAVAHLGTLGTWYDRESVVTSEIENTGIISIRGFVHVSCVCMWKGDISRFLWQEGRRDKSDPTSHGLSSPLL